ncbi:MULTISPECIES: glycosyltransferase family 4 protein [unclassified Methylophaga]|uniref:glycosyltransferase family 4 protein n=1 Tax=unclassified Methylophaga TaxID=2629249 RepID=UPI000C926A9F|nr:MULTISPECIES: glycosyltransferase family 4 protein [unclassified Methylophaga]MBN47221.1 glycosyl transferase family 1 [Methylophaga sp.]
MVGIYAQLLAERGHQISIIYPKSPRAVKQTFFRKCKDLYKKIISSNSEEINKSPFFDHGKADMLMIDFYDELTDDLVPDADVIIATFWMTTAWIKDLSPDKGEKFYFIQHYEMHDWLPKQIVKGSYKLPFKKIVVSEWIADSLLKLENCLVDAVVLNGVDTSQFYAPIRTKQTAPTIGFMYSDRAFKGTDLAVKAIDIVRHSYPELKIIVFSSKPANVNCPLPGNSDFYLCPEQSMIKELYAKCDAWLFTSRNEGFGLPILEAMACRTPVIATPAGAATSLINSKNGYLLDDFSPDKIAKAIIEIIKMDNKQWGTVSENAFLSAKQCSWENSVIEFESALIGSSS